MAKKFKCKVCGQTFEADSIPEKCPICGAPKSEIEEVTEPSPKKKKKGFDTNGNAYTIIYASIMVILVAFLLAFVASSLKPTQDANVVNDVKNQILTSLNIESKDIEGDFNKIVKDMLIKDGELVEYDGKFQTSYSQELKDGNLHLFVATLEDGSTKYVVPMVGRGLWGGLWGYILHTVYFTLAFKVAQYLGNVGTAGIGIADKLAWG